MIYSLKGEAEFKNEKFAAVKVAGISYKVFCSPQTLKKVIGGQETQFFTHLHLREDAVELYGFLTREELELFEILNEISGIGPKTALGILNVASPATLRQAVASSDITYLTRVSGIGKKNAEKIVLELKNKLKTKEDDMSLDARSEGDALEALVSLGYSERDAREALKKVPKEVSGASERVKQALRALANPKH